MPLFLHWANYDKGRTENSGPFVIKSGWNWNPFSLFGNTYSGVGVHYYRLHSVKHEGIDFPLFLVSGLATCSSSLYNKQAAHTLRVSTFNSYLLYNSSICISKAEAGIVKCTLHITDVLTFSFALIFSFCFFGFSAFHSSWFILNSAILWH